ncbi:MAG: hypothetical protein NTW47_00690, partial [Proteobacteria bacterium]|nr:hypothetical protein [Pseudomonadota bacterium]
PFGKRTALTAPKTEKFVAQLRALFFAKNAAPRVGSVGAWMVFPRTRYARHVDFEPAITTGRARVTFTRGGKGLGQCHARQLS